MSSDVDTGASSESFAKITKPIVFAIQQRRHHTASLLTDHSNRLPVNWSLRLFIVLVHWNSRRRLSSAFSCSAYPRLNLSVHRAMQLHRLNWLAGCCSVYIPLGSHTFLDRTSRRRPLPLCGDGTNKFHTCFQTLLLKPVAYSATAAPERLTMLSRMEERTEAQQEIADDQPRRQCPEDDMSRQQIK